MASIRKDQLAKVPSFCAWNKHLRPDGKRMFWKAERAAARRIVKQQEQI